MAASSPFETIDALVGEGPGLFVVRGADTYEREGFEGFLFDRFPERRGQIVGYDYSIVVPQDHVTSEGLLRSIDFGQTRNHCIRVGLLTNEHTTRIAFDLAERHLILAQIPDDGRDDLMDVLVGWYPEAKDRARLLLGHCTVAPYHPNADDERKGARVKLRIDDPASTAPSSIYVLTRGSSNG